MKLLTRILLIAAIVLFVMLVLYPVVHETGHILAALIAGEPVVGVGLFPAAYTRVSLSEPSFTRLALLCFGGAWFPLLFLLLPTFRSYLLYCVKLTTALLTAAGALGSFFVLQGIAAFGDAAYDDAALILRYFPERRSEVTAAVLLLFAAAALYIVLSEPLKKTITYLEKTPVGERQNGSGRGSAIGGGNIV